MALFLLTCWVMADAADGHSFVVRTEPKAGAVVEEPPGRVMIVFDEAVELEFGGIRVTGPDGARVDQGRATHPGGRADRASVLTAAELPNGRYEVRWRVVASDGHPRSGRFAFRVRAPISETASPTAMPSAMPTPTAQGGAMGPGEGSGLDEEEAPLSARLLLGVSRGLVFGGVMVTVGFVAFLLLVWRRPKHSFAARPPMIEERFAGRWHRVVRRAWQMALVGTLASIVVQGAVAAALPMSDLSLGVVWDVLGTRFGRVALFRLGILILGAVAWRWALKPEPARAAERVPASVGAAVAPPGLSWWPLILGGLWVVALLTTVGMAGHAGTTGNIAVNMPADVIHLLGASAWAGGLVALLIAAFPSVKDADPSTRLSTMAPVISRFSDVAVVSIAAVVGTGVLRSWIELEQLGDFTGTAYGQTLLVKLTVFVPVLLLGAINNRVTKPACETALLTGASDRGALDRLRRLITIEVALAVAIIALTAFLVNLEPPGGETMHV